MPEGGPQPWHRPAALEAARADGIEQDIRDAAVPPVDSTAGPVGQNELADAAPNEVIAMTGMLYSAEAKTLLPEEITVLAALISPRTVTLTEDEDPADHPFARSAQDDPASAPAAARAGTTIPSGGGEHGQLAAGPDEPAEHLAALDVATPHEITPGEQTGLPPPVIHPVFLARRDLTAEPLFPLPAAVQHPATQAAPARRRGASRWAAEAARDAVQPTPFRPSAADFGSGASGGR